MTPYRALVLLGWLTWIVALTVTKDVLGAWERVGAMFIAGQGFAQLWRAQSPLPPILRDHRR